MSAAIQVVGVGKRYWKLEDQPLLVKALIPFRPQRRTELWALRNINLTVSDGETVGIIGRNGSGKTTMLRLLAGVTSPTEGSLTMRGRLAPLVGVGVGFKHEMTGRENVMLNGMLLGLTSEQVAERFDDIVAFAEMRDFINTPVKFYSSGMFLRLAFAIAVHTEPEIFLVDEILAVGDLAFQSKCFMRMKEIQERGTTIVLVSHSIQAIHAMCSRAILLHKGEVAAEGTPADVIAAYHDQFSREVESDLEPAVSGERQVFIGGAEIVSKELLGEDGGPAHYAERGSQLSLRLRVRFEIEIDNPMLAIQIFSQSGELAYGKHSRAYQSYGSFRKGDEVEVRMSFLCRLAGGTYRVTSSLLTSEGRAVIATDQHGEYFFLEERAEISGTADLSGRMMIGGLDLDSVTDAADPVSPLPST